MGIPTEHIELMRGLIGDIQLEDESNSYKVSYVSPCSENNPDDIKAFSVGEVYAKDSGGTCSQIPDTNKDLVDYVTQLLTQLASRIRSKGGAMTTDETDFVSHSPLSPVPVLKTAVAADMEDETIAGLAEITAKAYSLQMLSDLYVRAEAIAMKAREILKKQAAPASGQPYDTCATEVFAVGIDQDISQMLARIKQLQISTRASYVAAAEEMNTIMEWVEHKRKVEVQMTNEIVRRYGKDIAERLQM
jgi:conjugative transfer pilus assembly protein TraH